MDIYKIMIVDDEADVREGIVRHLDWDMLGFEVFAEAENGQDALEKAEACEIDVVLTDIKMPFMDGLTMCTRLLALYPAIKIIILTGFDEFEYAKTAVSLNAVEYVLKPINVAELTKVMQRVRVQLDDSVAQKRDMDALRKSYARALPLMRERFLTELLLGVVQEGDVNAEMDRFGVMLPRHPTQVVAVFEVNAFKNNPAAIDWELTPVSVKQIVDENLAGQCTSEVVISTSTIIAMTAWDEPDPISALMRIANEISLCCARVLHVSVTAGIGKPHPKINGIHSSFLEAKSALEYKTMAGSGRAIYIQDMEQVESDAVSFDSRSEQQLLSVIKFGTYEQIRMHVEDMLSNIENVSAWEKQAYLLSVFNTLFHIIQRHNLHAEEAIVTRMQLLIQMREGWQEDTSICDQLCNICSCMGEFINAKRVTAAKSLVEEAKRYIDEHYADNGLSVERLCGHLHISQTYFSAMFKQETGMSYVQYLTETRMNKAIALLQETDDKTYIIAQKVGYDEPNYFSYVFKKRFGVSPTKYRK